jgi:type VI protein secretion system component Hcp
MPGAARPAGRLSWRMGLSDGLHSMIYLKITFGNPVKGSGTTVGYEEQIDIESFDWKVKVEQVTAAGTKEVRPKVTADAISLDKFFDASTSVLCSKMDDREQFSTATITMLTMNLAGANGQPQKLVEMILYDGYIKKLNIKASESGKSVALKETLTLTYDKLEVIYYPMDAVRQTRGSKSMPFLLKTPSEKI